MSEFIGDTSYLTQDTVPFSAVHTIRGKAGSGSFVLTETISVKALMKGRAYVTIDPSSLIAELISPPAPDQASHITVAVIPSVVTDLPSTTAAILTIAGSIKIQSSTYDASTPQPLVFAPGVAHQIEPKPLIGYLPQVVYSFSQAGAADTTEGYLRISGTITARGIGFIQTW
jgi:hypothetical protein